MGMKVSQLAGDVRETTMYVGPTPEDTVWLKYRPGALTLEMVEKIAGGDGDPSGGVRAIHSLFSEMLLDWDLMEDVYDEKGDPTGEVRPLPCNSSGLRKVPVPGLRRFLDHIMDEVRPESDEGKGSGDSSPQMERQEQSQSGSLSSV